MKANGDVEVTCRGGGAAKKLGGAGLDTVRREHRTDAAARPAFEFTAEADGVVEIGEAAGLVDDAVVAEVENHYVGLGTGGETAEIGATQRSGAADGGGVVVMLGANGAGGTIEHAAKHHADLHVEEHVGGPGVGAEPHVDAHGAVAGEGLECAAVTCGNQRAVDDGSAAVANELEVPARALDAAGAGDMILQVGVRDEADGLRRCEGRGGEQCAEGSGGQRADPGEHRTGLLWEGAARHEPTGMAEQPRISLRARAAPARHRAARDGAGQLMKRVMQEMRVIDPRTFELVFTRPYGIVPESLSKVAANVPFMMPKRIAETDPYKEIPDPIGSGPFRFVRSEFAPGTKVVYEKNRDYVPRAEPPSGFAGGKVVNVDRVEWLSTHDPQTAMSALIAGEIDMWENPLFDLAPALRKTRGVVVETTNKTGIQGQIYFNQVIPPFDNVKARQAMLWLTHQADYLQIIASDPANYRVCTSMFTCGTPMENTEGSEPLTHPDRERAKQLFKESGWDFAKPIVILDPVDETISHPAALVTADALRSIGLAVDLQAIDWATALMRRNSREPTSRGGWNILHSYNSGIGMATPVWSVAFSGACEKGLFGWPCDKDLEDLRLDWALTSSLAARQDIARRYQARAFADGHHVPLGQWNPVVAHRDTLTGVLPTHDITVFWGMKKTGGQ